MDDVHQLADTLREYLVEAIHIEEAGLEVEAAPELTLVQELQDRLADDPDLKVAFESLTPGRQRDYNLHIGGAKQAATRTARVDRYSDKIRAGKGLRDR